MPLPSRKKNTQPPFRRVVDFDIDDRGLRLVVLSCGHKVSERMTSPKKLNGRVRCVRCKEEGNFGRLPGDSVNASSTPRFCKRCGCRLREGQKNEVCSPCSGG